MKAPGTMHWKLRYDGPVSNFAFKFSMRRYTELAAWAADTPSAGDGRAAAQETFRNRRRRRMCEYVAGRVGAAAAVGQPPESDDERLLISLAREAGIYTRPLLSSARAVSATKYTLNTP